ncbi:MAG: hypothetical protein Q4C86_14640 [bacterium]|nr:hypothetical protein [bacterium]
MNEADRLVYEMGDDGSIVALQCKGHYGDR